MAYPITGGTAVLDSVTSSTDVNRLLVTALSIEEVTYQLESDTFDITPLDGSGAGAANVAGLMSGTVSFSGYYPKPTPRIGNSGLVSFATSAGYAQVVKSWKIDVDFGEIDITSHDGSAVAAKRYMPSGVYTWGGSYTAHAVSDDTEISYRKPTPINNTSTGGTATFKITEGGASDPALTGSIIVSQIANQIRKPNAQELAYTFRGSGAISETVGSNTTNTPQLRVATSNPWGVPDWDTNGDGVPDVTLTYKTFVGSSTLRYTSACFLKSVSIECTQGQPIKISGVLRLTDAITFESV